MEGPQKLKKQLLSNYTTNININLKTMENIRVTLEVLEKLKKILQVCIIIYYTISSFKNHNNKLILFTDRTFRT